MVYIILGQGFEEIEAISPCDILRRGEVEACYAAVGDSLTVAGGHGIRVEADTLVRNISPVAGDYILIPGGMGGVDSIKADKTAMDMIKKAASGGTKLAAICAGPSVLAALGLLGGKHITCYPGCEDIIPGAVIDTSKAVSRDGDLVTGRAPGAAVEFGLSLLEAIAGKEKAKEVADGMVFKFG